MSSLDTLLQFFRRYPLNVVQPDKGPWENDNQWGTSRSDVWPASPGQTVIIVDKPRLPGPPAVHTILFDRSNQEGQILNSDIRAVIEYGAGGTRNTFLCDWQNGGQISLVCNSLRIGYQTFAPHDAPYVPQTSNLNVGVAIGRGNRGNGMPATYTAQAVTIHDGSNHIFPAPDFAKRVTILQGGIVGAPFLDPSIPSGVTVLISGSHGAEIFDYARFIRNPTVTLPGGCKSVTIINNTGGGASISPFVIWELSL